MGAGPQWAGPHPFPHPGPLPRARKGAAIPILSAGKRHWKGGRQPCACGALVERGEAALERRPTFVAESGAALGWETAHWGRRIAYPNAPLPAPMRIRIRPGRCSGRVQPAKRAVERASASE